MISLLHTRRTGFRFVVVSTLLFLASLWAGPGVLAAGGHDHEHDLAPRHGGVVAQARDLTYELVAGPGVLQLHVRDHDQPADVSQASAQLVLQGKGAPQQVVLAPVGPGLLEARGSFVLAPGSKVVAQVRGKTQSSSLRFVLP